MEEPKTEPQPETVNDPLEDDALREEQEHPELDQPPQEPETETEPDGDDTLEPGPSDEEQERQIQSEKDLMKRDQKLDAENTRHAKRVGEIMEEAGNDLIPCPVCMDGIAGWVYSPEVQQLSEEAILRLRQLIGLSGLEGLLPAKFGGRCSDCDGQGQVKTGSRVAGFETVTCEGCKGHGWRRAGEAPANGHVDSPEEALVTGPTVFQADSADPEIVHLRERGFTVIPPMQVQSG